MAIYLIRHAHAGNRSSWAGDDLDRPLSDKGRDQARHLSDELGGRSIGRIFSSPARRCIETVEPLGELLGREVRVARELAEGVDAKATVAFLLAHADHEPALCTHGDVVPKVLRQLHFDGMRTADPKVSHKGSVWVLDLEGDRVVRGTYLPPA